MTGLFLALVALCALFSLSPVGIVWTLVWGMAHRFRGISRQGVSIAIVLDILCKHLYVRALDDLFLKSRTHSFGNNIYTTISEDLGIFSQLTVLSGRGEWLVQRLHYLDPWHVEKAMGLEVPKVTLTFWQQVSRFAVVLLLFSLLCCVIASVCIGVYLLIHLIIN